MRRLIIEEPKSAAALWSWRLALFALAVAAIGIGIARAAPAEILSGLSVLAAAFLVACASLLFAATGAVIIWRTGRGGFAAVVGAVVVSGLFLAYPAWLAVQSVRLPLMNDISTDLTDPPAFSRSSAALAARGPRTPSDTPETARDDQRRAYPNVQPIILDLEADEAYRLVLQAATARGWRIIDQTRPGGRSGVGRIDAVDRSLILGFPEDVTIRVRPLAGQTRIDIRSASRYGRHDFGTNAARIARFAQELQTQLDAR